MPITRPSRRDCREPAARRAWFATLLLFAVPACRNAPQAPADARSVRNQEENADRAPDPLATEIQRWSTWLEREPSQHESFVQVKQATAPLLAIARQAVESDHRLAAAYRVAQASPNMAGIMFQLAHAQPDQAALAAEWQRVGAELQADRTAIEPAVLADIGPAAMRALAEAAAPEVRGYHAASLDYGRATMPEAGLFYLGAALGERALVALLRRLHEPAAGPAPALRPIGAEIAGLDREMLAAYRPPLSIDRHAEFVAAHSALQEARDLDAAGLRHGALLRYLQAALRFAPLRAAPASIERKLLAQQLASATAQLREDGRDHSLAAMLLEVADVELTTAAENAPTPAATAIAGDTLPRYLAAIGAAPERPAAVAPELTVTLVRWPYG